MRSMDKVLDNESFDNEFHFFPHPDIMRKTCPFWEVMAILFLIGLAFQRSRRLYAIFFAVCFLSQRMEIAFYLENGNIV